jgi:hypothetical protein
MQSDIQRLQEKIKGLEFRLKQPAVISGTDISISN